MPRNNGFGNTWDELELPVKAKVGIIDDHTLPLIGLSAMQLSNIGHEGEYNGVVVSYIDKTARAQTYNAFGMHAMRGEKVRISSILATQLECKVNDFINIESLAVINDTHDHPLESSSSEEVALALGELARIRERLETQALKHAKRSLYIYLGVLSLIGILIALLTIELGWDTMEPWTYFVALAGTLGGYIYFAITEKEWSPNSIFKHMVERNRLRLFERFGFDLEKYEELLDRQ